MDPRGRRWWGLRVAGGVGVVLMVVWTAAGTAGLLVSGSWPDVSLLGSIVELVRLLGGGAPAAGIPRAVFWLCLLLELGAAVRLAVQVRRWRGPAMERSWSPRPAAGEPADAVSFEAAYARAVRADRRSW